MNGSRTAALTPSWRLPDAFALGDFPVIPTAIIVVIASGRDLRGGHRAVQSRDRRARRSASSRLSGRRAGATAHLLGTDHLGRDVLSRLIFGARVSMVVGFTAVIVAGITGTCSASSPATWAAGWTR